MKIFKSIQDLKEYLNPLQSLGFVPTMGALHEGHASLLKKSKAENETTLLSIFVNPTQFNDKDDLQTYPSDLEQDLNFAKNLDINAVFLPDFKDIYPDNYSLQIVETDSSKELCGVNRPEHFSGVLTVVMKLLNIVQPQKAYFGEKDYQQYELIKKMSKSFFLDTEIIPCPIIRDKNGLALSSRNKKLSNKALALAPKFYQVLKNAETSKQAQEQISNLGIKVEYVKDINQRRFGAIFLENIRLIDNAKLDS